jgi:hypothetical protein
MRRVRYETRAEHARDVPDLFWPALRDARRAGHKVVIGYHDGVIIVVHRARELPLPIQMHLWHLGRARRRLRALQGQAGGGSPRLLPPGAEGLQGCVRVLRRGAGGRARLPLGGGDVPPRGQAALKNNGG